MHEKKINESRSELASKKRKTNLCLKAEPSVEPILNIILLVLALASFPSLFSAARGLRHAAVGAVTGAVRGRAVLHAFSRG